MNENWRDRSGQEQTGGTTQEPHTDTLAHSLTRSLASLPISNGSFFCLFCFFLSFFFVEAAQAQVAQQQQAAGRQAGLFD